MTKKTKKTSKKTDKKTSKKTDKKIDKTGGQEMGGDLISNQEFNTDSLEDMLTLCYLMIQQAYNSGSLNQANKWANTWIKVKQEKRKGEENKEMVDKIKEIKKAIGQVTKNEMLRKKSNNDAIKESSKKKIGKIINLMED